MTDNALARTDPYLAGSIAARSWDWWHETTAEQEADALVRVEAERRADFLRGWHAELAEREQERKEQRTTEYEEMAAGYEKGDPAAR